MAVVLPLGGDQPSLQHRQGATSGVGDLVREEADDRLGRIRGLLVASRSLLRTTWMTPGDEVIDDDGDVALPRTVLLGDGGRREM